MSKIIIKIKSKIKEEPAKEIEEDEEEDNQSNEEEENLIDERSEEEEKNNKENLQKLNEDLKEDIINERNNYEKQKENEKNEEKKQKCDNDIVILELKKNILMTFYDNYKNIDKTIKIFNNQELPNKLQEWTDEIFNKEKAINKGVLYEEKNWFKKKLFKWEKKVEWCRASEVNYKNLYIIKDKPDIKNIRQSKNINDCYFLSALGALCEKCKNTDIIKNLFYITERTIEKAYGVYFYINGIRQLVLIDDYFPYYIVDKSKYLLYYSSSYEESELWVSLLEKAWAKIKGSYKNADYSKAKEAFEALTGTYTIQRKIKKIKEEENDIWNYLKKNKDYLICAGIYDDNSLNSLLKFMLKKCHEYTVMDIIEDNNIRKIKLKDPYGKFDKETFKKINKSKIVSYDGNGIFTIGFNYFIDNFNLIEINHFKPGLKTIQINISKEEAKQCYMIQIENEYEKNEIYINLFQKKYVYSYIMLIKKESNDEYVIIDSVTSLNEKNVYDKHFELKKVDMEKGTYYICCDVNDRYLLKDKNKIEGYLLNIYSLKDKLFNEKKFKILEKEIKIEIHRKAIYNYTINYLMDPGNKEKIYKNCIRKDKSFPFEIYYYKNINKKNVNVKFEIIKKYQLNFCFYNDDKADEKDGVVLKELEKDKEEIVCLLQYKYEDKKKQGEKLDIEIL